MTIENPLTDKENEDSPNTGGGLVSVSGGLAVRAIENSLKNGKTIEIPSLGIKIEPEQKAVDYLYGELRKITKAQDLEEAVSIAYGALSQKLYDLAAQFHVERYELTEEETAAFIDMYDDEDDTPTYPFSNSTPKNVDPDYR